jgi:hypothetical protein
VDAERSTKGKFRCGFSLRIEATGSWPDRLRLRRAERLFGLEGEIKATVQAK